MLANGLSGRGHMVVRFTSTLYLCTSNHPIKFNGFASPWLQQLMPNFVLPYCIGLKYAIVLC